MRSFYNIWLIATLLGYVAFTGCKALDEMTHLSPEESKGVFNLARQKLEQKYPNMDAATKEAILLPPSFGYYRMSGDYYQYFINWRVSTNWVASVSGQGDIKTLDGANVRIMTVTERASRYY